MRIVDVGNHVPSIRTSQDVSRRNKASQSFAEVFKEAFLSVDTLQKESDVITEAFVIGDPTVEVHDVVVAAEKARLALDLTVSIRNKLVEAYQEIMRMQI
ncbi:MAG: flagellar hook-basal body complex protein FliE [Firmicutes bacterium]|nr:flagellar hook-basal body complex protein FliE [Bacillota bacterium]